MIAYNKLLDHSRVHRTHGHFDLLVEGGFRCFKVVRHIEVFLEKWRRKKRKDERRGFIRRADLKPARTKTTEARSLVPHNRFSTSRQGCRRVLQGVNPRVRKRGKRVPTFFF